MPGNIFLGYTALLLPWAILENPNSRLWVDFALSGIFSGGQLCGVNRHGETRVPMTVMGCR